VERRGGQHRDRLSEYERYLLAEIEQTLRADDPEFCDGFGRRPVGWNATWLGAALFVLGAAAAIATFTASIWLASAGLALMGTGAWVGVSNKEVANGIEWVRHKTGQRPRS
jgi:hypothetical protein